MVKEKKILKKLKRKSSKVKCENCKKTLSKPKSKDFAFVYVYVSSDNGIFNTKALVCRKCAEKMIKIVEDKDKLMINVKFAECYKDYTNHAYIYKLAEEEHGKFCGF